MKKQTMQDAISENCKREQIRKSNQTYTKRLKRQIRIQEFKNKVAIINFIFAVTFILIIFTTIMLSYSV